MGSARRRHQLAATLSGQYHVLMIVTCMDYEVLGIKKLLPREEMDSCGGEFWLNHSKVERWCS